MKLADVSINKPVFATMMIMSLVVLGLFSFLKLNVDLYPNVDIPFVIVTTVLPGAGPEQIETDVTKKIEDAINTVNGVDYIQSTSQENVSLVIVAFKLEIDGKVAAQDVREKISAIRADLPDDIEAPIIQRYDPASFPIMSLAVSGNRNEKEITEYTKNIIKKRLENVPGVGNIELVGGAEREIGIEVDAAKLESYKLSIQDVIQSVNSSHVEIPGGNIIQGKSQVLLRTMAKFKNVEEFNNIIVANPQGKPVYLRDIARAVDGVKEQTSLTRLNGKNAVGLNILKQSGGNTVDVATAVNKELQKLRKELPSDISIVTAQDNSTFIKDSIRDVLFDIIYGGLLAIIVIYLFLANMRATIISALALPSSIIASFIMMYALNFTLNVMSLLALSLAVGLLIDDAIVVIENIYRHMQMGETPFEAAKSATEEIGLAVMATTFTVVAVFVPVAFMPGIVGRFFYQFGMTVSVAVIVSLFVAFSLTPMLSSRFLHKEDEALNRNGNIWDKFLYYFNHVFEFFSGKYQTALGWALRHRFVVIAAAILTFVGSFYIFGLLGSQFFPESDRGEFYISIKASAGSSLEQTSSLCSKVEDFLRSKKEVVTTLTKIGAGNDPVTKATIFVKMTGLKERKLTQQQLMNLTREFTKSIPGARFAYLLQADVGGNDKPLQYSVRGDDISKIKPIADKVEQIVRKCKGTVDVDNSLELSKPEIRITLNREKANDVAVNPYVLASTVRAMVDGFVAAKYQSGDEQIDIRVKLQKKDRSDQAGIRRLTIKSGKDKNDGTKMLIPISEVANIENNFGPSQINRYNRKKEIRVDAALDGSTLGEVVNEAKSEIEQIPLEAGYSIKIVGEADQQAESFGNIFLSLALAIIFVYIVLAAQFESFVYPFSIMLALPMSIIGAALMLWIFGSSVSVMSLIGIIMLMGLATKNGILLVDYANVLRERGLPRYEALLKAGPTRLRPILMTSFAMIFGMVPVALALSEGSEFRAPMGQAVIGGIITSTFLTLFIVPVVYTVLDDYVSFDALRRLRQRFRRK
ncbi:MAG: efflux RND transporter permease subunit [Ignavibacteria bacterium]|nr:efflux RND transporter permease subunit [Ignavibacteria bacterium]